MARDTWISLTGWFLMGRPLPKAQGAASPPGHPRNRQPLSALPLSISSLQVPSVQLILLPHFLWKEGYILRSGEEVSGPHYLVTVF